ncbi:mannose-1-phosphate guanylyltransferase/mannose-6-phosphate isomerase [Serratia nevei]|uniref:mannose-1-phosphate guanylyltransferase/mannose-6-phosphate isomerase n=1 Tax=Serratia nevei TaxID=2703794 RepID=UPI0020A0E822|nr:mannose-1-phosphate guanylyltransferase/mannose-6-phosphate isomerase [Serratia nevei]MCP1104993.1 mannose-1-phosphate guanylyltransferase/mannose-6-phosphate isomerase [Serratia nevei]
MLPIIMAGGSGSRLWPLSREHFPKQFLALHDHQSMLQTTITRLKGLEAENPIVICNENHRFIVAEQLRQIGQLSHNIILEPIGRNTAPAVALAALRAVRGNSDPLLLVLAADHVITDACEFQRQVIRAMPAAEQGNLVTFGIVPHVPETGYGYIRTGKLMDDGVLAQVAEFVEKPDLPTAEKYVASGEYLWNSGMFLFKASTYLKELGRFCPDIVACCEASLQNLAEDMDFVRVDRDIFATCPDMSIDYAVMEHTQNAVVVPLNAGWSDVGSWSALWDISEKDDKGNSAIGDVMCQDTANSYVRSEHKLVATVGVENLIVVETKDAILIANKDRVQDVKSVVADLKRQQRSEYLQHREVYRPWGKYDSIDEGERYKVKRVTVKPGERLSLQMHHHRAEHWIVVAGTAKVTLDGKTTIVAENESIYIPLGATHALENPGKIALDIIEVRSGAYLEEDDIVRFEDRYGRI